MLLVQTMATILASSILYSMCMHVNTVQKENTERVSRSLETYQNATPNMAIPKKNNPPNIELVEKAAFRA